MANLLIVDPDPRARALSATVGRAWGFSTIEAISHETALDRVGDRPLRAVVTAFDLPGRDGLALLGALSRRHRDAIGIITSVIPLAPARTTAKRFGLVQTIDKRGPWAASLANALSEAAPEPPQAQDALRKLILSGNDGLVELRAHFGPFTRRVDGAADLLVGCCSPSDALTTLEATARATTDPATISACLDAAAAVGGPTFATLAHLTCNPELSATTRTRALFALARHAEPEVLSVLRKVLDDPAVFVRHAAAQAALEFARSHPAQNLKLTRWLASSVSVAFDVRAGAVGVLAREMDDAGLQATLTAATDRHRALLTSAAEEARRHRLGKDEVNRLYAAACSDQPSATRVAALRGLAAGAPERVLGQVVAKTRADADPGVQTATLLAAVTMDDTRPLAAIADDVAVPPSVRGQALRLLASRSVGGSAASPVSPTSGAAKRKGSIEIIARALDGDGPVAVRLPALLAAMQLGPRGHAMVESIARAEQAPNVLRIRALHAVAQSRLREDALAVLFAALDAPSTAVATTAHTLASRLLGGDYRALLDRVEHGSQPELQHAFLEGAMALGQAGFAPVADLVNRPTIAREVRLRAVRHLSATFAPGDVHAVIERAKQMLTPAPANRQTPATSSPRSRTEARPSRAPARPAARPNVLQTRGDGRVAFERANTRPEPPASIPADDPSNAVTQPNRPAKAAIPATGPAPQTPESAGGVQARASAPAGATGPAKAPPQTPEQPEPRLQTRQTPAEGRGSRASRGSRPARPAGTQRAPLRVAPSSEAAARLQLQAALHLGAEGLTALTEVALAPTVPVDLRVTALRHLAHEFPKENVLPVIERAITHGPPKLQHAALAAANQIGARTPKALSAAASAQTNPDDVRLRALRQLHSSQDKAVVASLAETLLDDPSSTMRRAALEAIFPSMRHTQDTAIEGALVNLLVEHPSDRVKTAAAKALATFGTSEAVHALVSFTRGLLTKSVLKTAARDAVERIAVRDPRARAVIQAIRDQKI